MTKQKRTRQRVWRFILENIGITVFGFLVPLLAHLSGFFSGKEAIFGAVAGVYWIPPLRDALMRRLSASERSEVTEAGSVPHGR